MTTSRISAVALALSIAFGFVGGAGSTQRSAKDQNLSGTIASSKRMADGKEWTTANLNVNTSSSYCYDDAEPHCRRYGRLYTWESAQRGCQSLGDGWRLPTDDEWRQLAKHHGGVGNDSPDKGKAAYTALLSGGRQDSMPCWVAIAPLMESTTGWRHTECTGRYPKTIRSPHRSITSPKAVKGSIVGPRARSRWQFPCVASGSDRWARLSRPC